MGLLYIISEIILLILFIFIKKSEKKINITSFICISIVTLFCYNAFSCYVLTLFSIPTKLWVLALINLVISICFIIKIRKTKQIQKYSFNKVDIVYVLLTLVIVLIISYINFGIPFDVKYETSDPSVHYLTSVMFAESESLLVGENNSDPIYKGLDTRKFVSYVNSGLLMKVFCKDLEPMQCYNVFVIFGVLTLFLTGISLYGAFTNFAKNNEHRLWAFIVSLICMLGYPLNSFLFGFEYLSMGLLIICSILDIIYYYDEDIIENKYFLIIMTLLSCGLFSSYYMFVTFIYLALGIYFYIKTYQKTRKLVSKEIITLWTTTLIIPFVLGYIYHIDNKIYCTLIDQINSFSIAHYLTIILCFVIVYLIIELCKKIKIKISSKFIFLAIAIMLIMAISLFVTNSKFEIKIDNMFKSAKYIINNIFGRNGYTYINLYSNMLLLIPLTIYLIIKDIYKNKLKKNSFITILLIFIGIFIGVLYIGYKNK